MMHSDVAYFISIGENFEYIHDGKVMGWIDKKPDTRPNLGYISYANNTNGKRHFIGDFLTSYAAQGALIRYCREEWLRGWRDAEADKKAKETLN